jgi:hypothetical protein
MSLRIIALSTTFAARLRCSLGMVVATLLGMQLITREAPHITSHVNLD